MAGDGNSYLQEYALYFKNFQEFVAKLNYEDDLLPSNLKCRTGQDELIGECLEWTLKYLRLTKCPQSLVSFLAKSALDQVNLKNDEYLQEGAMAPNMVEIINEICLQYCGEDNPALHTLPPPPSVPTPVLSSCAIKNTRRRMENRHAFVEDLDTVFNLSTSRQTNYYGVFDGHSGVDAATYCSTHMHCFIAQSPNYPSDPARALHDAFAKVESLFSEKCVQENINGGCTALCVLHRPADRSLHVAWVGDSQAIVVSQSKIHCLVNPHKPDRPDEQKRIEQAGGVVLFYGAWRVNGQLAVSRAIGDVKHKPHVSGVPEITSLSLNGDEDFLVLGCDGLWDSVKESEVAATLYEQVQSDPGDVGALSQSVVSLARRAGSQDNISVLVVLLRPAPQIVGQLGQLGQQGLEAKPQPEVVAAYGRPAGHMDILDAVDNASNPFLPTTNGLRDDGALLAAFDNSPSEEQGRGGGLDRKDDDDEEEDDDLGPETDVDAVDDPDDDDDDVDDVDDVLVSPTSPAAPPPAVANPFLEKTSLDASEVLALALGGGDDDQPASLEPIETLETLDAALEPLEALSTSQLDKAGGAEVAENVGESEESEDEEWNYFRVKPTEQATDSEGALEDMESQLNPNAAVFVPSTPPESSNHIEQPFNENLTQEEFFNKNDVMSSSFIARDPSVAEEVEPVEALNGKDDEVWLSSSPKKGGVPLDNVLVPPEDEFDAEACQRPSDLDVENEMNLRNGEKPNIIEDTNPFSATDSILPQSEENNCVAADSVPDIVNDVGPVESQDADELVADAHFDCAPLSEPSAPIEAAQTLLEEFSSEVVPGLEAQNPLSNPFEAAVISPPQEEAFSQDANEAEILPSSVNLNFSQISEEGVSPSPLDDSVFLAPSEGTSFLQPEPAYTQDADRSGSPIVSGGATGFVADYDNSNQDFMMPPSQENNVSDLSSEPLNEGVVYSVSGFDNMMDAPSVTHNTTSPMMNDLNAQSTPFDANKFEFGVSSEVSEPKEPECEQVERNAFSQQVEAEVHSQFQQGDFIEDGVENNLNAGFVEIPTFPAAEKDGFEEGQMFATEHIPEATSPLPAAVEPPTFAEDVPERDVSNMEADFLGDLKQPSVEQRHELVEQMFEQEPSSRNQEVCLQFENESPAVSCDIPLDNGEKVPAIESQDFIEPTPAIHVNGFEEAISPDVNGYASQSPEIEVVYQKFSDEAQSTVPPCSEASEIPVDNNLQADPIPPVSVNGPAADVSSPVVASATGIAAAGAAIATGAAAAVAVAAAASKTDKKPASKEPVSKAKPSAGAKAPAKAPVKATSSSASAPKKPIAPVPAARAAPAPRTTTAPKPKPSETATSKPAVSARPAPPKPRTTVPVTKAAVTEKKPLTNGDAAKAATAKAPSRPLTRPATAPARTTARPTTTTSTAAKAPSAPSAPARPAPIKRVPLTTAAAPKPKATEVKPKVESKPTVGVASRPRPASAISSTRPAASAKAPLANKPIDKQTKETTNKLISATRSTAPRTAATSKPLASKTASSAATTTASSKAVPSKPAPIRRPASTTAVKSTVGKKAPITNGIVKNGQNGHAGPEEPVQNGVCHDEPVIEKRESDLKIESVDNQLVA